MPDNKNYFLFLILLLFVSTVNLFAQEIPELNTDRPDQTDSPVVIPLYSYQIETGFIFEKQKWESEGVKFENENISLLSTLFRYSFARNIELRAAGEYFTQTIKEGEASSQENGINSLMIGTKYQFRKDEDILSNAGLIFEFALPFGNANLRPSKMEPRIVLAVDQDIEDIGGLGVNIGESYSSIENKNYYLYSASLGLDITEKIGGYLETYGNVFANEKAENYFDAGLTYLFNANFQVDVSFGKSLENQTNSWFINCGISFRFLNKSNR